LILAAGVSNAGRFVFQYPQHFLFAFPRSFLRFNQVELVCTSISPPKKNGFLIPLTDELKKIKKDKVLLEIEILDRASAPKDYSALDELVGLCETKVSDASINHDKIIYAKREER